MKKIKILFTAFDRAGIWLHRIQNPALSLEKNFSDDFEVEINQNVDFNDFEYLKQFDIIQSHRQFGNYEQNETFFKFCKENNIITVLDIDDYPILHHSHPLYIQAKNERIAEKTFDTISKCDGITTTTEYFKNILQKYNKNVQDFENGIDPEISTQFKFRRKDSDRLRFGWVGGSSHMADIEKLKDLFQVVSSTPSMYDKVTYSLHGYDLRGSQNSLQLNEEMVREYAQRGGLINTLIQEFSKCNGDINKLSLPNDLKEKYKHNFIITTSKPIGKEETVWYAYEKIFTDNYKLIRDEKYLEFLKLYENLPYSNEEEQPYRRFFTKPINSYGTHYDTLDVSIVPLVNDSEFNRCKSALKISEAVAKKCALIVSDHPIYTKYIKHEVNGLIAKDNRDYTKLVKRLINNPNMVEDYQNKLIEDLGETFSLTNITAKRAEFYKELYNQKIKQTSSLTVLN